MEKFKISAEEFNKVSYKRLANSPGANSELGESRLKGNDLKARMDEPFELFLKKFNALVALVSGNEEGDALAAYMPTGIGEAHTFADLVRDIVSESAEFASYLSVGEQTLLEKLKTIHEALSEACKNSETAKEYAKTAKDDANETKEKVEGFEKTFVKRESSPDGARCVYTTTEGGLTDGLAEISAERTPNALALRDGGGRLKVGTPVESYDAVNKEYFDGKYDALEYKTEDNVRRLEQLEYAAATNNYIDKTYTYTPGAGYSQYNSSPLPYGAILKLEGGHAIVTDGWEDENLIPTLYNLGKGSTVGVNHVVAEDGRTVTLSGTAEKKYQLWFVNTAMSWREEPEIYFLSGCPEGGGEDTYWLKISAKKDGETVGQWFDYGKGVVCDLRGVDYDVLALGIGYVKGATLNNAVFTPEFLKAKWVVSYGYPTAFTLGSRSTVKYRYDMPDGLRDFLSDAKLGWGLSGNYIDFKNKQYRQYYKFVYDEDGDAVSVSYIGGKTYDISEYVGDMFFETFTGNIYFEAYDGSGALLSKPKLTVAIQYRI